MPCVLADHVLWRLLQVLGRYFTAGEITSGRTMQSIRLLEQLPVERYSHQPLLERMWQVGANLTSYDAAYVVLTEALDATLLTRDRRLAKASGHRARIELV